MTTALHNPPWLEMFPLSAACMRDLRRRAIFECCKWDPQVEDVDTLAPMAVVLKPAVWRDLQAAAEALAAETLVLERALLEHPELHRTLALPRAFCQYLAAEATALRQRSSAHLRVMRFDFHPTDEGWRVSEANTDVPGGYNEASGWTSLVAEHVPEGTPTADPAEALVEAIAGQVSPGAVVALVHATAYSDDRQVMSFLGRRLECRGFRPVLVAPDHLDWQDGLSRIKCDWFSGRADFVFRFFPAEWLVNLPRRVHWAPLLGSALTPLCNPACALLSQTKRWPLVCRELGLDLPAWAEFLPETHEPRDTDWHRNDDWVLKPALGRVGDLIGINGVTEARDWKSIRRGLRWHSRHWVAQRRFTPTAVWAAGQPWHLCLGVYTINGRAAGIYGRIASKPLINHLARDVAVLVERAPDPVPEMGSSQCYEPVRTV